MMRKLSVLVLLLAVCATASASIITMVDRANGVTGDRAPIGAYGANTAPLSMPEGGLQNGTGKETPYVYSDREFWWDNIPEEMIGWEHIRTFNNDKGDTVPNVTYTVTISSPATVWIAFDGRLMQQTSWVGTLPPWGNGAAPTSEQDLVDWLTRGVAASGTFTDTSLTLGVRESSSTLRPFTVYSASLSAGSYVFGHQSNKNVSNYVMGVVPEPATMSLLGLGAMALIRRRR